MSLPMMLRVVGSSGNPSIITALRYRSVEWDLQHHQARPSYWRRRKRRP